MDDDHEFTEQERETLLKALLLNSTDERLQRLQEHDLPLIRRVVRAFDDMETSKGLADLDERAIARITDPEAMDEGLRDLLG